MKKKVTASLMLIAVLAVLIIGLYSRAHAGQYDVAYPIRNSGTGSMSLPYTGSNSAWQTIPTTATNGFVQTTGSGLTVNPSPVLAGTASIPSPVAGEIATGGTGQLCIYSGTNWRTVP